VARDIHIKNLNLKIKEMKFTKSLKFKLTIWYSLLLSLFSILFVLVVNILITDYMKSWTPKNEAPAGSFWGQRFDRPRFRTLSEEQQGLIMESRMEDLENIRRISIYMVFPLVLMSFGGGYLIAIIMLRPLEKLNEQIERKETENLNDEIPFEDNGDEISQLIKSFNRMSRRLGKSFDSQKGFVENASHEIKTPLSVIQANIDTILNGKGISKKESEKLLLNSKKQIKFMSDLTEDLLLLSSVSNVSFGIKFEKVSIREVIEESIDTLKGNIEKKNFNVETKFPKKTLFVNGNKTLLIRAVTNIIENSLKYSEGKNIEISVSTQKDMVQISVKDDGRGIPEEEARAIFERFYRLDKGRSRKEGGSGLGLAITKEIIERHGGSVYVNTEYKDGAEFLIGVRPL
jgi:signal transduction histidine kinase